MPKKIQNFARSALVTPITVNVGRAGAASMNIIQDVEFVTTEAKIIYILGKYYYVLQAAKVSWIDRSITYNPLKPPYLAINFNLKSPKAS